jgi:hypothetical protein
MPLFHFNLANHVHDPDLEGTVLASAEEARTQAIIFAGSYLRDNPGLVDDGEVFRVEVTDDRSAALFTVKIELIEQRASRFN